jgi:lysozyme family protein
LSDFQTAVDLVLKHEGGYVNDPSDPGGETNFGVAKRWHPDLDIKNLTAQQASTIYQQEYWKPYMEQELDQRVANCALDCAVNQGPAIAQALYGQFGHSLKAFQLARLLRYASLGRVQDNHSWFERVLDV